MSSDHLVDTVPKLGRCNRCQAYVFLAMSSGVRSAADVAPADRDGYVAALVDGRRTFGLAKAAGRPSKLLVRRLGDPAPSFDAGGRQAGTQRFVLVEHGCGGRARNMLTFEEVPQGPHQARVTPGGRSGGIHQPDVPAGPQTAAQSFRSPAPPATPRPSDPYPSCGTCRRYVKPGELYWGIQHGTVWIYCEHEECP